MPINYQQVRTQIREMGGEAIRQRKELQTRIQTAQTLLNQQAANLQELRDKVDQAVAAYPTQRCAFPIKEPLTFHAPLPEQVEPCTVIAADGSQIPPSRHEAVDFGLVNVGIFHMAPGETPSEQVISQLMIGDALYSSQGRLTEDMISVMRDVGERTALAGMAASEIGAVVTLTDGGLEIFREPREDKGFQKYFNQYVDSLRTMARLRIATAAYVDRPRADLVVRLLELMLPVAEQGLVSFSDRPLGGVTDAMLYSEVMQPGERSAVLGIQSLSARDFTDEISLCFFYLNVASAGAKPYLARVEIPAWVADSPDLLDRVHSVLYSQAQLFGIRPYPYALHRAHEVAVVRYEEREQVEMMINAELMAQGMPIDTTSNKQSGKNLPGRTRVES